MYYFNQRTVQTKVTQLVLDNMVSNVASYKFAIVRHLIVQNTIAL